MTRLLRRASLRFYLRHPWQLGLAIAGISLGVGVYVGVSLANDSAARAFDVAAAEVRGAITHRMLPLGGSLDERLYRDLVSRDGGVAGRAGRRSARSASRVEPTCACRCSASSRCDGGGGCASRELRPGSDARFAAPDRRARHRLVVAGRSRDELGVDSRRDAVVDRRRSRARRAACSASCRRPASTSEPSRRSWPTSRRRKSCSERFGRISRIDLSLTAARGTRARAPRCRQRDPGPGRDRAQHVPRAHDRVPHQPDARSDCWRSSSACS